MTFAGIITMVLSCGIAWALFIICCIRLIKSDKKENSDTTKG